jgi:cobalt/nickel transport system permease protein
MLAMHMANELLTPAVAGGLIVVAAGMVAFAAWRTQRVFDPARVPLMGVLGAFVFAAQMINFPVLPGTSGHLGGGLLLALLLGPHPATLVMASILIVQCLIFQDGGLLALGANIINLGVIPCYLGYALFRVLAGRLAVGSVDVPRQPASVGVARPPDQANTLAYASVPPADRPAGTGRAYVAVFTAGIVAITTGAALVPVQSYLSGVVAVPLPQFLLAMIGLHLLIALVEVFITVTVIGYLGTVRPELVPARLVLTGVGGRMSLRAAVGSVLVVALLLGGVVSLFASEWPDALESLTASETSAKTPLVVENPDATVQKVTHWQERTALLPDYQWTSISGLIGTLLTLVVVWLIGRSLRRGRDSADSAAASVR